MRSSKDKRFSEINETIKAIRNHKKIKDIAKVHEGILLKFVLKILINTVFDLINKILNLT